MVKVAVPPFSAMSPAVVAMLYTGLSSSTIVPVATPVPITAPADALPMPSSTLPSVARKASEYEEPCEPGLAAS